MISQPLIIAYYDGDSEVRILSNFARTPFILDGIPYLCVEAFWQSLKIEDPIMRAKFTYLEGYDSHQLGKQLNLKNPTFTYLSNTYKVGSWEHHILLERAIRAKTNYQSEVKQAFELSGDRPLKHMLLNKVNNRWYPGDSSACPAAVFEDILTRIRDELKYGKFNPYLELPKGIDINNSPFIFEE